MSTDSTTPDFRRLGKQLAWQDAVVSFLSASGMVVLVVVLWLAAVWISNQVWAVKNSTVGVELMEIAGDGREGASGDDPERGEDSFSLEDDTLMADTIDFKEAELQETMTNVLDSMSVLEADVAPLARTDNKVKTGKQGFAGGTGLRGSGEGKGSLPRALRWSIVYGSGFTTETYAKLLDFFKIELGVVRAGRVTYVSNLSKSPPTQRRAGDEGRLFFQFQERARLEEDRNLLKKLGIPTEEAVIVQFFPPALEAQLAQMEKDYANLPTDKIKSTKFGIKRTSGGYEFYVLGQSTDNSKDKGSRKEDS